MFIDKILNKSKDRLNEIQKDHEKLVAFTKNLLDLDYIDISLHAAYADGSVTVGIPTRKDLEIMMKEFPPVDLILVQNGSSAIMPLTQMEHRDRNSSTEIAPVYFQLREWVKDEIHKDFIWFCKNGDQLIKVVARVKDDPAHYEAAHSYGGRWNNTITRYGWRPQSLPGTKGITYDNSHAPATPNIVLSYWEKECTLEDIFDTL